MPKVVFFSNYLNHHQLPFCKELVKLTNNNFYFVSQKAISEKRISFGYKNIANDYDFNVRTYESKQELDKAYDLANTADYVLFGSSDTDYIKQRLKDNKITFKYSERLFRDKVNVFNYIRSYRRVYINHKKYKNKNLFMLCNGAYAAYDFNRFGAYINKIYKWAYFTENIKYDIEDLINRKSKDKISIIWVGRFMELKHPEMFVKLAECLKQDNYNFEINVIGNGELEEEIKKMVDDKQLKEYINFLGSMSPDEVRKNMEKNNIFIFTSDHREGWGAVVNEAMNSGCACVCSHAVGSTTYLIKHKMNGLIYKSEDFEDLLSNVKYLFNNPDRIKEYGINAYKTIDELWNAKVAAERFIKLNECLLKGEDTPYADGPCSKAIPISEDKMYDYLVNGKDENS
jgi:glycosyltransferase involved in cell wall biosynthesis